MSSKSDEDIPTPIKNQIEKNRLKAIALKKSKLVSHPYSNNSNTKVVSIVDKNVIKIGNTKYKDTGGGFLLEEPLDDNNEDKIETGINSQEPPIIEDQPNCLNCEKPFATSWLLDKFNYECCDECKNTDEVHKLIAKTEALTTYLLKDCDLEKRHPPLKFITRKNPHNVRWGEMKLYLELQVKQRALEVWGDEDKIEEERQRREEKKVVNKTKKYHKQLKELRMNMRSSLYDRTTSAHTHEFGAEIYNEADDTYTKSCSTCPYQETFEKM